MSKSKKMNTTNLNHTSKGYPCYSASILVFFHSNFEHRNKPKKPNYSSWLAVKCLFLSKIEIISDKDIL